MRKTIEGPILDVGCGRGGMIELLKSNNLNVFGVDPIYELLTNLKDHNVVEAVGEALPYPDNYFGTIYFMHSFAHIPDPDKAIDEAYRVLKPRGSLFIITPNSQFETIISPLKKMLQVIGRHTPDEIVQKHFNPAQLRSKILKQFSDVESFTFGKLKFQRIIATSKKS